jgi:membrane protease YdiL (CAAX protease family)
VSGMRDLVRATFVDLAPRDHAESDARFRRRRVVAAITLVAGATLLGFSLAVRPGNPLFYPMTLGVAVVWVAGSLISGPLHLGRITRRGELRRPILTPIAVGVVVGAVFVGGAFAVRYVPPLAGLADQVLDHARYGSIVLIAIITLVNGVAEEVFFRGALFAAIGRRHPVLISTVIYGLATVATLNVMLVFAAVLLGAVLGLERRASGGILGPILTHITWSMIMLFALPPVIGAR